jgi:hypothetical protein
MPQASAFRHLASYSYSGIRLFPASACLRSNIHTVGLTGCREVRHSGIFGRGKNLIHFFCWYSQILNRKRRNGGMPECLRKS